eukprot:CAMPEP_0185814208 /NCGR_PEP_ID=MMETSP1322-20130828/13262_1 /TAXON_ID=265543 /ORGANISM="Minutocellus polymorphus, Strain RCC2270" /LENGTH=364 /DNA_ID=CAMNT_0028510963 /DNA_START=133 /DNA_END=1225 /DNA_ORIENTATION=+
MPSVNLQLVVCSSCSDSSNNLVGRPARDSAKCNRKDEADQLQARCREIEAEKENTTPSYMAGTRSSRNRQVSSSGASKSAALAPSRANRSAQPGQLKNTGPKGPKPTLRSLFPARSQAPKAVQNDRYVSKVTNPKKLGERREREMRGTAKDAIARIGEAMLPNAAGVDQVNFVANAAAERALQLRKEQEDKARKAKKARATGDSPAGTVHPAGSSQTTAHGSTGRRNAKRGSHQRSPPKQPTERRPRRDNAHEGADDGCAYARINRCVDNPPPELVNCAVCNNRIHHVCQGEYLGATTLPVNSKEYYCPKCVDDLLRPPESDGTSSQAHCTDMSCDDQGDHMMCPSVGSGKPPPRLRPRRKVVA